MWDSHPLLHKEFLGQALIHCNGARPPVTPPPVVRDARDDLDGCNASAAMATVAAGALTESGEQPSPGKVFVYSAASHADAPPSPSWVNVDPPGVAVPAAHDEPAPARWYRLTTGDKHADEVHHRLESHGHGRDDLGEILVICESLPGGETGASSAPRRHVPTDYQLDDDVAGALMVDEYLHVDVAYGRNLLASDFNKGEAHLATSDPYAVIRLWPPGPGEKPLVKLPFVDSLPKHVNIPGTGRLPQFLPRSLPLPLPGVLHVRRPETEASFAEGDSADLDEARFAHKRRTRVVPNTLDPEWNAAFAFRPRPGLTHIKVTVWDRDVGAADADDYIGEVLVPLPKKHKTLRAGDVATAGSQDVDKPGAQRDAAGRWVTPKDDADEDVATNVVQGWFPLQTDKAHEADIKRLLRRMGRPDEAPVPPALGEVFVRVSFGPERDLIGCWPQHRPSLRSRIGTLRVRVLSGSKLPDLPGEDVYAVHVLFEQKRSTTRAIASKNPIWNSSFEYGVTEIAGDVVLRLLNRGGAIGEVCVPVASLLPFDPADPRTELEGHLRTPADAKPQWYDVLKPRRPGESFHRVRNRPAQPLGSLCVSLSLELCKTLPFSYLAPEVLPLAAPPGRSAEDKPSFANLTLACSRLVDAVLAIAVAPLRTVLYLQSWQAPHLNACLLALLLVCCSTAGGWRLARAFWPLLLTMFFGLNGFVSGLIQQDDPVYIWQDERESDIVASRIHAQKEKLREWHRQAEQDIARNRGETGPRNPAQRQSYLAMWRNVQVQLAYTQDIANAAADKLEKACNALSWTDPHCSAVSLALLVVIGLLGCCARLLLLVALHLCPLEARHAVAMLCLLCLAPAPYPMRRVLDSIEESLMRVMPVPVGSLTLGAGLESTRLEAAMSSVHLRAKVALETAAAADARQRKADEVRDARSRVQGARLGVNLWGALCKVIDRAPNNARVKHVKMTHRCLRAQGVEAVDKAAHGGPRPLSASAANTSSQPLPS